MPVRRNVASHRNLVAPPPPTTWALAVALALTTTLGLVGCTIGSDDETQVRELVIASDLSRKDPFVGKRAAAIDAGARAVIESRGARAGIFKVRYVESDFPAFDTQEACEAHGTTFASNKRLVAVIGPQSTACARFLVPALNRAGIALVSPTEDAPGLTHELPGHSPDTCFECSPTEFYPTGVRNYARAIPAVDSEGRAAAQLLAELGARRVFVLSLEGDVFSGEWIRLAFSAEARKRRLRVVRRDTYFSDSTSFTPEARRVLRSGADALLFLGPTRSAGARVLRAVRRAGFEGVIVSSLSVTDASVFRAAGRSLEGVYFTSNKPSLAALSSQARRFVQSIGADEQPTEALLGAEAAEILLDAIAASDGTRPGVREALFKVNRDGLLGRYSFDANGDVQPQRVAIFRARGDAFAYDRTISLSGG